MIINQHYTSDDSFLSRALNISDISVLGERPMRTTRENLDKIRIRWKSFSRKCVYASRAADLMTHEKSLFLYIFYTPLRLLD